MVATHRLLFNTPPYPVRVGSVKSKAVVVQKPCVPELAVSGSVVVVPGSWLLDREVLKGAFGASRAGRWSSGCPGGQAPPLSVAFSPGCRPAFLDQKKSCLLIWLESSAAAGSSTSSSSSFPSPLSSSGRPLFEKAFAHRRPSQPLLWRGAALAIKGPSFKDLGRSRVATLRSLSRIANFEVLGMGRVVTSMALVAA